MIKNINFNNIKNLTNIFIKDNNYYLKLFDYRNKKINKKSLMFWILVILIFAITYLSYEVMKFLVKINKPGIFIKSYFLFSSILIIFQTIMVCTNIFYFSKDIENIIHLPLKPVEILISKFNTIVFMLYSTEIIFILIPLIVYGVFINAGLLFLIKLILSLAIFPVLFASVISIIMMFFMQLLKNFRNKDMIQTVISLVLVVLIVFAAYIIINNIFSNQVSEDNISGFVDEMNLKIKGINNYFIIINPIIKFIEDKNLFVSIFDLMKIILIDILSFIIFILLGNKIYLKQLLKYSFYTKNKKEISLNLESKLKKNNISKTFIKKEFNLLFKNPIFFIQCVYPVITFMVTLVILIVTLIPKIYGLLQTEEYSNIFEGMSFDIEAACIIIGITQVIGLLNYSSVTAFSREGKDAYTMKYLPVSLYKQFIFKNIPQVFLNSMISFCLVGLIFGMISEIPRIYFIPITIITILFNLINSYILSIIDLLMPKLKWDSEYEILKNNKNKLLQYVLIVLNIIFIIYLKKLFMEVEFELRNIFLIIILFLFILFFVFNVYIKKNINKLFRNIN